MLEGGRHRERRAAWVVVGGFVAMLVALFTVVPWLLRGQSNKFRARFDAMDARFDAKFDVLAGEVHEHGERLTKVEGHLTKVEERLTGVEQQVTQLRGDADHLSTTMTPIVDELLRAGVTGRRRAAG